MHHINRMNETDLILSSRIFSYLNTFLRVLILPFSDVSLIFVLYSRMVPCCSPFLNTPFPTGSLGAATVPPAPGHGRPPSTRRASTSAGPPSSTPSGSSAPATASSGESTHRSHEYENNK